MKPFIPKRAGHLPNIVRNQEFQAKLTALDQGYTKHAIVAKNRNKHLIQRTVNASGLRRASYRSL